MKALLMILAVSLITGCAGGMGMHSGTSSPAKDASTDIYQPGN